MKIALLTCVILFSTNLALAQTPPPSSTNPTAASSPHQRDATSTTAKEAPTPASPEASAASSPHQKQVTEGAAKKPPKEDKAIHDCVKKSQSENSSLSKDDAKKACVAQAKSKSAEPSR
jgi:hypothetical protein